MGVDVQPFPDKITLQRYIMALISVIVEGIFILHFFPLNVERALQFLLSSYLKYFDIIWIGANTERNITKNAKMSQPTCHIPKYLCPVLIAIHTCH